MPVELDQLRLRLDREPAPALQIEPIGHVVGDRVTGADIDVEPGSLVTECRSQMIILKPLRIRKSHGVHRDSDRVFSDGTCVLTGTSKTDGEIGSTRMMGLLQARRSSAADPCAVSEWSKWPVDIRNPSASGVLCPFS